MSSKWGQEEKPPPEWQPQARIRVTQSQAVLLEFILEQNLQVSHDARAQGKEDGLGTKEMNRTIKLTKQMLHEVKRTMEDFGWETSSS